ncbi:hypothetical protein [Leptospira borgpetersenii]|uniref:hypothetical protein n=1 Tax=Leptospira borgpetersenii TaxID=174 RepID=UPI00187FF46C|nr:hypothetical protein [Leptospira borgpetersenii serovar Balcanica]MBE8366171.1 hypothetical protein [Leptospira borgpetersenii serovar Balcanica]MBE8424764.1 hypothetical protein [Leptospira borgpetersenii serovar Balcanica]MBF3351843.1 hypothetical protein [Leptospira borgpetersenii serovar Balcanica]
MFFELPEKEFATLKLQEMGMVIIPFLLPYLSDTSPTQAVRAHGNGRRRIARVNEYIAYLINQIANHEFYLAKDIDENGYAEGGIALDGDLEIDTIRAFRILITDWYQKNKNKSLEERKLDDLEDVFHTNRFHACTFLGISKREKYRLSLENKIKKLFKSEISSLTEYEIIICAEALAEIGNPKKSARILRKVMNHHFDFYKPPELITP